MFHFSQFLPHQNIVEPVDQLITGTHVMNTGKNPTTVGNHFSSANTNFDCEKFVRLARQCFPASTKFYLSEITGIPARTVERHLEGSTKPGADHLLAYFNAGAFGERLQAVFLNFKSERHGDRPAPIQAAAESISNCEQTFPKGARMDMGISSFPKLPIAGGTHVKSNGKTGRLFAGTISKNKMQNE